MDLEILDGWWWVCWENRERWDVLDARDCVVEREGEDGRAVG
jgi:hypothetical protein